MIICTAFIEGHIGLGLENTWKYKKVIELIFENGTIKKEIDQTKKMEKLRAKYVDPSKMDGIPEDFENRSEICLESFELSYKKSKKGGFFT